MIRKHIPQARLRMHDRFHDSRWTPWLIIIVEEAAIKRAAQAAYHDKSTVRQQTYEADHDLRAEVQRRTLCSGGDQVLDQDKKPQILGGPKPGVSLSATAKHANWPDHSAGAPSFKHSAKTVNHYHKIVADTLHFLLTSFQLRSSIPPSTGTPNRSKSRYHPRLTT